MLKYYFSLKPKKPVARISYIKNVTNRARPYFSDKLSGHAAIFYYNQEKNKTLIAPLTTSGFSSTVVKEYPKLTNGKNQAVRTDLIIIDGVGERAFNLDPIWKSKSPLSDKDPEHTDLVEQATKTLLSERKSFSKREVVFNKEIPVSDEYPSNEMFEKQMFDFQTFDTEDENDFLH
jgi:hypothetical protein